MSVIAPAPNLRTRQHEPERRLKLVSGTESAAATIRVAVAGRQALARAGMRVLLEREVGIVVVGEASTSEQAVAVAHRIRPDVVVIDVDLPGLEPVRLTRDILAQPGIAVMLLADRENDARVLPALRAGARGVLLDNAQPDELVRAVRMLARGATALPATVADELATADPGRGGVVVPMRRSSRLRRTHKEQHMLTPRVTGILRGCAPIRLVQVSRTPPVSLAPAG